jgi:hypothetical protein
MEQQEITVCAAITISGPLVYHLIRWNVAFPDPRQEPEMGMEVL